MPLERLKKHLDDNEIKYVIKSHSIAYTTPEIAAMAHVPGKEWAKTVIIKIDDRMAMAVLSASYRIDFGDFKKAVGAKNIELAIVDDFIPIVFWKKIKWLGLLDPCYCFRC